MGSDSILAEFRDCRLLSVHFELNRNFAPGPEIRLNSNLMLSHDFFDDDQDSPCLRLFIKMHLHGEGAPLNAEVEMGAVFGLSSKPANTNEATQLAEINCAAIVFPYLRETVADLTRRAGLAPLNLPPINFVEFYKSNHPDN